MVAQWLLLAWAFFIPLTLRTWIGWPLFFLALFSFTFNGKGNKAASSPILYAGLLYLFVVIVGVFYSQSPIRGIAQVVETLPILYILMLSLVFPFSKKLRKYVVLSVVMGTVSVCLFLLIRSVLLFVQYGDLKVFFGSDYIAGRHFYGVFLSLYISFSTVVLLTSLRVKQSLFKGQNLLYLILLLLFGCSVVFIDSKALLLSMTIVLVYYAILFVVKTKQLQSVLIIPAVIFMLFNVLNMSQRSKGFVEVAISRKVNVQKNNSTSERIIFIETAVDAIKEVLPFGEGSCDRWSTVTHRKHIKKYYETHDDPLMRGWNMANSNAHNQFLDTLLRHGYHGLLILLLFVFSPLFLLFLRKQGLTYLFIILALFSFVTDGVLLAFAGVSFFTLLYFIVLDGSNISKIPLKQLMNIRSSISCIRREIKVGSWDYGRLATYFIVALIGFCFLMSNDIQHGMGPFVETRYTYRTWFLITGVVFFIRCILAFFSKEKSKKWIYYVVLLFFMPVMIIIYM